MTIRLSDISASLGRSYSKELNALISMRGEASLVGWAGSSLALLLSSVAEHRPIVCIMDELDEAGYLYADLVEAAGEARVVLFPSAYRRAIKYGHLDEPNQLLRSMALGAISAPTGPRPIIVTTTEALIESVASRDQVSSEYIALSVGETTDREALMQRLYEWGFERVDYVYEPGQYALRGSILDIFSYTQEHPYRLDFFDDELESIRLFDVETQLSVRREESLRLMPNVSSDSSGKGASLLALLPDDTLAVCGDRVYIPERAKQIYNDAPTIDDGEGFASLEEMRRVMVTPEALDARLQALSRLYYRGRVERQLALHMTAQPSYHRDFNAFAEEVKRWLTEGYEVIVATHLPTQYERICEILGERGVGTTPMKHLEQTLHEGFIDNQSKLVVLTEHQLFGRFHKYNLRSDKARSGKMSLSLKELQSFNLGDLVVHTEHGIGRFGGLLTMDLGGKPQEVIKITYRNNDTIYVNLHSLHKLSHYRTKDDEREVQLSALGTGAWNKLRERTKRQVKDIARDLIKLYAKRRESEGFAFSPDTYLQHELEASFVYEDTPDQAKATADIKADMERPYPMDRLLCGDVGFGKTEVAIRAAFKAATDGKQVAVLVPTTVLAYQHYRTFERRLRDLPVRIEYLSRARTAKEVKAILQDLKDGGIDIIIGTHKLTGKDVVFKDLGLLIIDEEQKFGVAVKEKLRKLQVNVDTLTMSATPIPRTLQFSLMGARDLSNINTPPPNRRPVETISQRFSAEHIREAINFELSRNGQIYFLHNRVQNIQEIAALVRREVPDARVVVGHGQMPPSELEQVLLGFNSHEYDVLIATTIIENGIDVPNANTIIINEAHRYGLSELHQLRGRVGRSDRKAFCYLFSPPIASLPEDARRRLRAIESFSDLGSGVRIALQDLDIRGAGNALGAEQSGFITDMGYETYQKVFEEAVQELKATEFASLYAEEGEISKQADLFVLDTQIESDLELCLPESYVPQDAERILLYRELDHLSSDEDLEAYRTRLIDRFGALPEEAESLIAVPRLRRLGKNLGIEKIVLKAGKMSFFLIADRESLYYRSPVFDRLLRYVAAHSQRCEFRQRNDRHIIHIAEVPSVETAIKVCKAVLATAID